MTEYIISKVRSHRYRVTERAHVRDGPINIEVNEGILVRMLIEHYRAGNTNSYHPSLSAMKGLKRGLKREKTRQQKRMKEDTSKEELSDIVKDITAINAALFYLEKNGMRSR